MTTMPTSEEQAKHPTATAREHRLRLFQPTRRPQGLNHVELVTPWGRIFVSGRLGQGHADVLDAICFHAERRVDMEDGRIKLLVDPARVRRTCGIGGEQLEKLARELREATIHIKEPRELACIGGLVDHIELAVRADGTPILRVNPLGGSARCGASSWGKRFASSSKKMFGSGTTPSGSPGSTVA